MYDGQIIPLMVSALVFSQRNPNQKFKLGADKLCAVEVASSDGWEPESPHSMAKAGKPATPSVRRRATVVAAGPGHTEVVPISKTPMPVADPALDIYSLR